MRFKNLPVEVFVLTTVLTMKLAFACFCQSDCCRQSCLTSYVWCNKVCMDSCLNSCLNKARSVPSTGVGELMMGPWETNLCKMCPMCCRMLGSMGGGKYPVTMTTHEPMEEGMCV